MGHISGAQGSLLSGQGDCMGARGPMLITLIWVCFSLEVAEGEGPYPVVLRGYFWLRTQVSHLAVLEGPYGTAVSPALRAVHGPAVMLLHPAALVSFVFIFVLQWSCSGLPLGSAPDSRLSGIWGPQVCGVCMYPDGYKCLRPQDWHLPYFVLPALRDSPAQSHSLTFTCCCVCSSGHAPVPGSWCKGPQC